MHILLSSVLSVTKVGQRKQRFLTARGVRGEWGVWSIRGVWAQWFFCCLWRGDIALHAYNNFLFSESPGEVTSTADTFRSASLPSHHAPQHTHTHTHASNLTFSNLFATFAQHVFRLFSLDFPCVFRFLFSFILPTAHSYMLCSVSPNSHFAQRFLQLFATFSCVRFIYFTLLFLLFLSPGFRCTRRYLNSN